LTLLRIPELSRKQKAEMSSSSWYALVSGGVFNGTVCFKH